MEETKFECFLCNFKTNQKFNYDRHTQSSKHLKNAENVDGNMDKLIKENKELKLQNTHILKKLDNLENQNKKIMSMLAQLLNKKDGRRKKEQRVISGQEFLESETKEESKNVFISVIDSGVTVEEYDDHLNSFIKCSKCLGEFANDDEGWDRKGLNNPSWICEECIEFEKLPPSPR